MALGKRKAKQQVLWVAHHQIAGNSHPFYTRLNRLLEKDCVFRTKATTIPG